MFKKVNIVPRWMILLLDLGVTKLSLFLAIVLKQNLSLIGIGWKPLINTLLLMGIINTVVFGAMKTFAGIVRYTGLQDAIRIAISIFISSIVLLLFGIYSINSPEEFILNNVVIILYATFSFLGLISYRVFVKFVFAFSRNYKMQKNMW